MRNRNDNRISMRWLGVSLVLALVVTACGDLAAVRQGVVLDRVEEIQDPLGFERIGDIELIDEDTGIRAHQGGYRLTWRADGLSSEEVVEVVVPFLRREDYWVEPFDGTTCSGESVRLFFIHEPSFLGSARVTFDQADLVVQLTAGWDSRGRGFQAEPFGETPLCEVGEDG